MEQTTHKFEMLVNGKMFGIVSDNLYQRPYESTVRELIANAIDITKESGATKLPLVKVTPTELIVRDYGSGLDVAGVRSVFLTYGYSTKEGDTDQTGGFGLGSKSPYSITGNKGKWYINSYCDGKKYSFCCYKNDAGEPADDFLGETPTEETGIEIIIPNIDYYEARRAVATVAGYCQDNFDIEGVNVSSENRGVDFSAEYQVNERNNIFVQIANMVYRYRPETELTNIVKGVNYYIVANKNQVELHPSREGIIDNAKNRSYISAEISRINSTIPEETKIYLSMNNNVADTSKAVCIKEGYGYCGNYNIAYKDAKFYNLSKLSPKVVDAIYKDAKELSLKQGNMPKGKIAKKRFGAISDQFTGILVFSDLGTAIEEADIVAPKAVHASTGKKGPQGPKHDFSKEFFKRDSFIVGVYSDWISWNNVCDNENKAQSVMTSCRKMVIRRSSCSIESLKLFQNKAKECGFKAIVRRSTDEFFDDWVAKNPDADFEVELNKAWTNWRVQSDIEAAQKRLNYKLDNTYVKQVAFFKADMGVTFDLPTIDASNYTNVEQIANDTINSARTIIEKYPLIDAAGYNWEEVADDLRLYIKAKKAN